MKYVVIQKTTSEINYKGDVFQDVLELFPDDYPVVVKHVEHKSIQKAREAYPGRTVMSFKNYEKYKAAFDKANKKVLDALRLSKEQKGKAMREAAKK